MRWERMAAVLAAFASAAWAGGDIGPEEAGRMLADTGVAVVDVRTPAEFADGHLPRARNIPLQELGRRASEVPSGKVLLVCRTGRRAEAARNELASRFGRDAESIWVFKGRTECREGRCRPVR